MKEKITVIIPLAENAKIEGLESIKKQKIKLISIIGNNPSKNRNLGIKYSKTPLIGFINAHTILREDWSKNVQDFFKKYPQIDILGGPQLTSKDENLFGKASGYALSSIFGAANLYSRYNACKINFDADEQIMTSANLICKKKVFKKVRFDEELYPGEDPKFISDAKRQGFKIAYSPDIVVYNKRRKNLSELFVQIFNYGKVRPKKEKLNETLKHPIFLIPSIFLIYLILLLIVGNFLSWFFYPLYAYITLNIIFSLIESLKNSSFKSFFLLPFIFFIINISYGLGFIYGLIKNG